MRRATTSVKSMSTQFTHKNTLPPKIANNRLKKRYFLYFMVVHSHRRYYPRKACQHWLLC